EGLDNFWNVLLEGKNCTVRIPKERFDCASWYDPDDEKPGKSCTERAALMEGLSEFDHKYFGIDETEAFQLDPQQKILLQCSYRALENAGIPMEKASETKTGVYIGIGNRDFEHLLTNNSPSQINHRSVTSAGMAIAANRLSYVFNFTGPSLALDTACSSSLVALHLACQAIRNGDCEMALCGAVGCILEPRIFVALSKAKMVSPEGTSKPFSRHADGYGRGEGCGIVVLKKLKKALDDFDHIWGVISVTAVNQDGCSTTPIIKPSLVQQEELLSMIYPTRINPSHVQYVEAHGTGTLLGDLTEAKSISSVIAKARSAEMGTLLIGSVKGNIGHTELTAGMAGLIKVLLMMHHRTIVPSLFYSEDSASIDAKELNVKVPTVVEKWEPNGPFERAAGISSFGFGGTNAHAVVKQHKSVSAAQAAMGHSFCIFILSAKTEKSIMMMIEDTAQKISTNSTVDIQHIAYTSACRRSHAKHKYRKAFVVSSLRNLEAQLRSALNKKVVPSRMNPRLIFVFCGNGVTYKGMCSQLLKEEPVFREKVKEIDTLMQRYKGTGVFEKLQDDSDDSFEPQVIQPLLFAIQVAIHSVLKHWGINADAIVGHSVGEIAAAHCSGLLSLEDAVKVLYFRSTLQNQVTGGKMLVISNVPVSEILKLLSPYSGKVSLAAFNSPRSCTLSGEGDAIDSLHQSLQTSPAGKDLFLRLLNVPAAYHSHMMDPILTRMEKSIGTLDAKKPETELFSTVTGAPFSEGDFCTGKYWARNIREPVAFEQAIKSAAKGMKNVVFLEIGPRHALKRNIMETLEEDTVVLPSVLPEKDQETLLNVLPKLYELGHPVKWEQFYKGCEVPPAPFPQYQFDSPKNVTFYVTQASTGSDHVLLNSIGTNRFLCNCFSDTVSYLREHKNNGVAIIPGSFYVELALASCMASSKPKVPLSSLQLTINFHIPFVLNHKSPELTVQLDPGEGEMAVQIQSSSAIYASGSIKCRPGKTVKLQTISMHSIHQRCTPLMESEELYKMLSKSGFEHGSVFRNTGELYYGKELNEVLSFVKVPDELQEHLHDYCIHPVVLDYLMQIAAVFADKARISKPGYPSSIGSVSVFEPLQKEMFMYLRATYVDSDIIICGCFTDKEGRVLTELQDMKITHLSSMPLGIREFFFESEINVTATENNSSHKPKALVFADLQGVALALKQYLHDDSSYMDFKHDKEEVLGLLLALDFSSLDHEEILFIWGVFDLTNLETENVMQRLLTCCECFRQLVLKLYEAKFSHPLRIITYGSSEKTVFNINSGFVLPGLTRGCAAEFEFFKFQLIDIESISYKDIEALGQVIRSYPCTKYPEIIISDGQIHSVTLSHTPFKDNSSQKVGHSESECFALQTVDPYQVARLSAIPIGDIDVDIQEQMIEIELTKVCIHSMDYFPVTTSDLNFGQTLYWSEHISQNHTLLALDFSGIVTAVGSKVVDFKTGDPVVSCYPVVASSKLRIPEVACYSAKKFPFLLDLPCMSYFVLAWEILFKELPEVNHHMKLGIISSQLNSALMNVLVAAAFEKGWSSVLTFQDVGTVPHKDLCDALVLLPPLNPSFIDQVCRVCPAKDIIVVCDSKNLTSISQNILKNENDNVCIHTVHAEKVFQKAYLRNHKKDIDNWLKSMHFDASTFSLRWNTFQSVIPKSSETMPSQSYFNSDRIPVIVLNDKAGSELSDILMLEKQKVRFQRNAVYVVSGGLSGLGFETVKFIAERGGGYIVTLSRRKPTHETQLVIDSLQSTYRITILCQQCDISITSQVEEAFSDIGKKFPHPVKGVFHSAVVLSDGLISTLNESLFEKVLKPKVNGVLNLHRVTRKSKLDYFVCYSSIASCMGSAAQSNYCAANSFLDLFCHYRRRMGLAAQSINWGPLNLGLLLNKDHLHTFMESKGVTPMSISEAHESLEQSLLLNSPQQIVCKFSFKNLAASRQNDSLRQRLYGVLETVLQTAMEPDPRVEMVNSSLTSAPEEYIRLLLCEICDAELEALEDNVLLTTLGVDSMLVITLQNHIYWERGISIPLVKLLDPQCTLSTLISYLKVDGETVE
ncbi:putative polyketide synthase 16, partial [Scleropages formosus]